MKYRIGSRLSGFSFQFPRCLYALLPLCLFLYQNRTVFVSKPNALENKPLIVSCKSYIYKLACIGNAERGTRNAKCSRELKT